MRYAVISDVHGNFTALMAVIEDCKNQKIDKYIFLGDYYGEFPQMNEVISFVKSLNNKIAIKGNKEIRMVETADYNYDVSSDQLAPLRWNMENISKDNYDYIKGLPEKAVLNHGGISIFAAHSPGQHFGPTIMDNLAGVKFSEQFGNEYSNHDEYLKYAAETIFSNENTCKILDNMLDGLYLFGHYHTQWFAHSDGKYLINPGACGLPLDYDCSAPYTILDIDSDIQIIERRVTYDVKKAGDSLINSDFFQIAPFWGNLSRAELENAKSAIMPFLKFVENLAVEKNDRKRPYSNELWREAVRLYKMES
jgi:predicted phosphodiesterase